MVRTIVVSVLLFASATASAHVTVPISFRELVTEAELIVRGRVTDVRAVAVREQGIDSLATVRVDATLAGDHAAFVTVRIPGGQMGRTRSLVTGAPRLAVDSAAAFFLVRNADGTWRPLGLNAGVVPIRPAPHDGRPSVLASRVMPVPSYGGGARPGRTLIPVEELDAIVRVVLEARRRAVARPGS